MQVHKERGGCDNAPSHQRMYIGIPFEGLRHRQTNRNFLNDARVSNDVHALRRTLQNRDERPAFEMHRRRFTPAQHAQRRKKKETKETEDAEQVAAGITASRCIFLAGRTKDPKSFVDISRGVASPPSTKASG